jgi:hypothetical protein
MPPVAPLVRPKAKFFTAITPEGFDACIAAVAVRLSHSASRRLECLHDDGLVLAPALQGGAALAGHSHQLGLAFIEYCLAVPANRYGSAAYTPAQLKTIQEVVTLTVFAVFSVVYLQQAVTWNQVIGFALIAGGAFFVFRAPL